MREGRREKGVSPAGRQINASDQVEDGAEGRRGTSGRSSSSRNVGRQSDEWRRTTRWAEEMRKVGGETEVNQG